MHAPGFADFQREFRRLGRRVRLFHALGNVALGASGGAALGALGAALAWALGADLARPLTGLFVALGAIAGAVRARRRRLSDTDLALYLDARLGTAETVTSALHAERQPSAAMNALVARATHALSGAEPRRVRLRWLSPVHASLPLGVAIIAGLSLAPLPRTPPNAAAAPGSDMLLDKDVPGLDRIEALEHNAGLSDADRERLRRLALDAKKLRADLARGMPRREAQARVARLRDEIAEERQRFADRSERPGLEAAVSAFDAHEVLRDAKKALGEGDLVAFDEEMQRLANVAESSSRKAAEQALSDAARAAREKGNPKLAALLDRQKKLFEQRAAEARALRELARRLQKKLGPDARRELQNWNESGSPEAQQRLMEALAEALGDLSENERKQLADALERELGADGQMTPMSREQIEELAKRLASPEGREALRKQLKELARESSSDAERERALEDAERGGAEAQRRLSGVPVPMPGSNPGGQGGGNEAPSAGTPGGNSPGAASRGGGSAGHAGETPRVGAEELRARAEARLLPGAPLGTRSLGRAAPRPGETANQLGTGQLGSVGAAEVGAVEGSDIPEEYREHVGRYFEP